MIERIFIERTRSRNSRLQESFLWNWKKDRSSRDMPAHELSVDTATVIRSRSDHELQALVGVTRTQFDREVRGRALIVSPSLPGSHLPFGWSELADILNAPSLNSDNVSLVREDYRLDRRKFVQHDNRGRKKISFGAIRRALNEGYSLIINDLEGASTRCSQFATRLSKLVSEPVGLNCYVSWISQDKAFGLHWDNHDILVMQTFGAKRWRVFRPTHHYPLTTDSSDSYDPEGIELAWEGDLSAGETLYIPRGWWHEALTLAGGSIHITASFASTTVADFVRYIVDRACDAAEFREDLPRNVDKLDSDIFSPILSMVEKFLNERTFREFWISHSSPRDYRQENTLPCSLDVAFIDDGARFNFNALDASVFQIKDGSELLQIDGKFWRIEKAVRRALSLFSSHEEISVQLVAMECGIGLVEARSLLFSLINEGIVGPTIGRE